MLDKANDIAEQITAWRREFHQYPELGFQEKRTSARVAEIMKGLGYRVRTGVGRTGVVADFGNGSPVVGIRADMDALPIQEANDVPYASCQEGVMHACGHDAHIAIALGAATLLAEETLPGSVRFLFQPSEEVADQEGKSGAPRMVEDGAMEGVDAVLALHVVAAEKTGTIQVDPGPSSAGVDSFHVTITGRGGHGAAPHRVIDPIYLAGHAILAINGIISRRLDPFAPAVISLGAIHGGDADNVIPDQVTLSGTIRYMDREVQHKIHAEVEQALEVARALGGDFNLQLIPGYPPSYNDAEIAALIRSAAVDVVGGDQVRKPEKSLGAEDFGFFSALAPGAMFYVGCRIEGDERRHHSPLFDVDERCLPIGAAVMTAAALHYLRRT